jgi:NDP-sugar pyrophosphorylase family protein
LKPYCSGFKKYKQSEEATKISQENKMNVKKKVIHHTTGSRAYAGKEETWQEQEEKAIQLGATPTIANWTEWSKRFVLAHGAVLTAEDWLEFKTDMVKQVVEMIEKVHAELEERTFVPSRDMDDLNYALQFKEHPGRTRV